MDYQYDWDCSPPWYSASYTAHLLEQYRLSQQDITSYQRCI